MPSAQDYLEQRNALQDADLATASSFFVLCYTDLTHFALCTLHVDEIFSDHKDLYSFSVYMVHTEHKQIWTSCF